MIRQLVRHWPQTLERLYPYIWAILVGLVAYKLNLTFQNQAGSTQISTSTTVASVLMGFLGTGYGLLLSVSSKRIEWAKGHNRVWERILGFFKISLIVNFALCIYSVVLASLDIATMSLPIQIALFVAWSALMTLAITSFYRAIKIMLGLLRKDS